MHLWKNTLAAVPRKNRGSPSGFEETRQEATAEPGQEVKVACTMVAVTKGRRGLNLGDSIGKMPGLSILLWQPS